MRYHSVDQSQQQQHGGPERPISRRRGCCHCGFSAQPWLRQMGSPWEHEWWWWKEPRWVLADSELLSAARDVLRLCFLPSAAATAVCSCPG